MNGKAFAKEAALHWCAVLALGLVSLRAVLGGEAHMPEKLVQTYSAAGIVLLAQLFQPRGIGAGGAAAVIRTVAWSLALGLLAAVVLAVRGARGPDPAQLAQLATGVAAASFLAAWLTNAIGLVVKHERQSRLVALALLIVAYGVPVWLGPVADWTATPPAVVNAIIAASPLTYFSVMAGFDYLRSAWFYAHTPYGGLRYAYPGALAYTLGYCLTAVLFVFLTRRVHHKSAWTT